MRYVILLGLVTLLSACGGNRRAAVSAAATPVSVPFSSGPIQSACLAADRKAANRRLCGCVQAVANQKLTPSQQRRAVTFFADPHLAQEARQNGSRRFWTTYKAFAASAERVCKGA